MKKYLLNICLPFLLMVGVAQAEVPNPINVGIISTESSTVLKKELDNLFR